MSTAHTCETLGCDAPMVAIVFWPGQTVRMCGPCAARALRLAGHMGFDLATADLDLSAAEWCEKCEGSTPAERLQCGHGRTSDPPCAMCGADRGEPCKQAAVDLRGQTIGNDVLPHAHRGRSLDEIAKLMWAQSQRNAADLVAAIRRERGGSVYEDKEP